MSRTIKTIRHRSPESVLAACYGLKASDLDGAKIAGYSLGGKPSGEMDISDAVAGIRRQGCWGFADDKRRTIQYWARPNVSKKVLLGFFAHEVGHLTGKDFKDSLREERRAEEFREVAETALVLSEKALAGELR